MFLKDNKLSNGSVSSRERLHKTPLQYSESSLLASTWRTARYLPLKHGSFGEYFAGCQHYFFFFPQAVDV